ncbi:MAG: hypothetical protein AB1403_14760, partial [Candidatus Riflebacteria bacterium]
ESQAEYLMRLNKERSPLSFAYFVAESDSLRHQADNPSVRESSGVLLPRELVAGILNRRLPIINTYKFAKEKLHSFVVNPKYYCSGTAHNHKDYLGVVQLAMIHFLINQNDLRFEKEACEFMDYLHAPIPDVLDRSKMADRDARRCYSSTPGGTRVFLPYYLERYINLCLKARNAPELNPQKRWVETEYAKNCDYYSLENWKDCIKKPPTEEEIQKFNEISRQRREEGKKRDKENERQNDETFLKNALKTLQQPNLTPQEKEYLERCINHIRNKKYEK